MDHMIIDGVSVPLDTIPYLLDDLDLLPLFVRQFVERKICHNIHPTDAEQLENLHRFLKKNNIFSNSDLEAFLSKDKLTENALSLKLYRLLQIEIYKKTNYSSQLESVFLMQKSKLDKVMYSMIRSKERSKIAELYLRIEEKEETFADLASQYSEGIEKQINGLILLKYFLKLIILFFNFK